MDLSKEKKNEFLYLPTDDTIDVGKEPLPIKDPKVEEVTKKLIKKFKVSCK